MLGRDRQNKNEHLTAEAAKFDLQSIQETTGLETNSRNLRKRRNKPRTAKVGAISKAQNLKGGPFGLCETPAGCKKFEKN